MRSEAGSRGAGKTYLDTVEGNAEEDHASEALLDEGPEEFLEAVDAPATLAREGGDVDAGVGVVGDEDGIHEHGLCEMATGLP